MTALPKTSIRKGTRTMCWLASMLAASGCVDGYPSQPPADLSPTDMTSEQRMARLNEIGAEASHAVAWSYRMEDDCVLLVTRKEKSWLASKKEFRLPLSRLSFSTEGIDKKGYFRVTAKYIDGNLTSSGHELHDQARWAQVVQFRAILDRTRAACEMTNDKLPSNERVPP